MVQTAQLNMAFFLKEEVFHESNKAFLTYLFGMLSGLPSNMRVEMCDYEGEFLDMHGYCTNAEFSVYGEVEPMAESLYFVLESIASSSYAENCWVEVFPNVELEEGDVELSEQVSNQIFSKAMEKRNVGVINLLKLPVGHNMDTMFICAPVVDDTWTDKEYDAFYQTLTEELCELFDVLEKTYQVVSIGYNPVDGLDADHWLRPFYEETRFEVMLSQFFSANKNSGNGIAILLKSLDDLSVRAIEADVSGIMANVVKSSDSCGCSFLAPEHVFADDDPVFGQENQLSVTLN